MTRERVSMTPKFNELKQNILARHQPRPNKNEKNLIYTGSSGKRKLVKCHS